MFQVGDRVRVVGDIDIGVGVNPFRSSMHKTGTIIGEHNANFDYDGSVWKIQIDGEPLLYDEDYHEYCSEEYLERAD
jgi:hypothetical protein